eukprot:Hpha_TRINITY_DN16188_c2_g1::TRINITY_DN16188_c2_g1_i2::g.4437::m.4437
MGGDAGENPVPPLPGKAVQVSTSEDGCNLVLLEDGRVVGWGKKKMCSAKVPHMPRPAVEIHAGVDDFAMALLDDDTLMCWGKKRNPPRVLTPAGHVSRRRQREALPERFKIQNGEWVPFV